MWVPPVVVGVMFWHASGGRQAPAVWNEGKRRIRG